MYFSRSMVAALLAQQTGGLKNDDFYGANTAKRLIASVAGGVLVLFLAASFLSILI